ncbi:gamma-glutamylcyclotransferase family protein [Pseudanabaena sp. FACHB-2040]|uniref:gamma-glutamylcyclotransferase family protein n=1 Tax=Pseudanabaena sp. FACHB-2040 TaxID=2692859 RepID=UPI0018F008A0|nr:gamma-glutamylcyclotransferase family protein [Pseudanabaena sp. FACHB-2040]
MTNAVLLSEDTYHIFVYGTLKPGERYYELMCAPYVLEKRVAIAPGRLYDLPLGYPAMTLEEGWVTGMRLSFVDWAVLTRLDEFEDYYPNRPLEESEYQRVERTIFTPDQAPLGKAWVYVMQPLRVQSVGGVWLPNGCWSGSLLP